MPYCPVIVRVSDELLNNEVKIFNSRYLLQVWDDKNEKVYEKEFQSKDYPIETFLRGDHCVEYLL